MTFVYNHAFITLASDQFEQLVDFYRSLLDQLPQPYSAQHYAEFQLSGLRLGIFKPRPSHTQEFLAKHSGSMSLCLEVVNLDVAIATLTQLGCPPPGPILHAGHGQEVYAYDPAGNRIILHQANLNLTPES